MTVELGRYGIWRRRQGLTPALAAQIEAMGYGAIWVGSSPPADLREIEALLAGTEHIAVATCIVNMWTSPVPALRALAEALELS